MMKRLLLALAALAVLSLQAQTPTKTYVKNPMLWADVPDPDVIRVGDTFYLVSTTMHLMPGAPVMQSKDLKNWQTVGYIFDRLTDSPKYDLQEGTVYGRGQWATSLKWHKGRFYALLAPNEAGDMGRTYIFSAEKAEGPWTLVSRLRHFHDATLFFDDDDRPYVFYGTGQMCELTKDLKGVVEGSDFQYFKREADERGLLEGTRVVKHRGRYYALLISHVFAPGHHRREVCYRADNIHGPYEKAVILESDFGGFPYVGQGTIVDSEDGDWYGIIFQDRGGVGRVLTLSPVRWIDGWPMIGDEHGRVPDEVRAPKGDCAGLAAFNGDSGVLTVKRKGKKLTLELSEQSVSLTEREKAVEHVAEKVVQQVELPASLLRQRNPSLLWLRVTADFKPGRDVANFFYSTDGEAWQQLGDDYKMIFDYRRFFMGSKFAIFCYATKKSGGYLDVDRFDYNK